MLYFGEVLMLPTSLERFSCYLGEVLMLPTSIQQTQPCQFGAFNCCCEFKLSILDWQFVLKTSM